MRRGFLWALAMLCTVLLAFAVCVVATGCGEKQDDGTAPQGAPTLPALSIQEDTPNLLLTWVDTRGDTHSALRPSEVPQEGKELVRVVIADREDGTRDPLYVVDLSKPGPGGAFAARAMSRREWEGILEKRREAYLGKLAPKPTAPPPASGEPSASVGSTAPTAPTAAPVSGLTVVIYGASWCKPCHQAADYLKSKGIPFVMKDVDESQEAAAEMQQKLARAGRRGGAIPVIDVRGQILVGYSRAELDQAIKKAGAGTVL